MGRHVGHTHAWREWGRWGSWPCHELSAVCRLTLAYGLFSLQNHSGSIEEGIWEKHRSVFRKCVRSLAPEREGEPESKPSPSFPAQVQPPAPGMCRHIPGMCFLDTLHPPSPACPSCWDRPPSHLWPSLFYGEDRRSHRRTSPTGQDLLFTRFFGGAQLLAAAAAVNSEYRWDTRVKNPRRETISDWAESSCGPVFQLHHRKFARGKWAEAWVNAKRESRRSHESFPDRKQSQMPNEEYIP